MWNRQSSIVLYHPCNQFYLEPSNSSSYLKSLTINDFPTSALNLLPPLPPTSCIQIRCTPPLLNIQPSPISINSHPIPPSILLFSSHHTIPPQPQPPKTWQPRPRHIPPCLITSRTLYSNRCLSGEASPLHSIPPITLEILTKGPSPRKCLSIKDNIECNPPPLLLSHYHNRSPLRKGSTVFPSIPEIP